MTTFACAPTNLPPVATPRGKLSAPLAISAGLKSRGLKLPPKLAVGDGGLGFWAALRKVYPATLEQRCWVHRVPPKKPAGADSYLPHTPV